MRSNPALRTKSSSGGGKNSNNETSNNNNTRPDLLLGTMTMDPGATGTFDQEAIVNALKQNDGGKPWLQEQPHRGKNANFKIPQRRPSETSSQLELTSYEQ